VSWRKLAWLDEDRRLRVDWWRFAVVAVAALVLASVLDHVLSRYIAAPLMILILVAALAAYVWVRRRRRR